MTRPLHLLHTLPPASSGRERLARTLRLAVGTLGPLVAGASFVGVVSQDRSVAAFIPVTLLALSAALVQHGQVGSQVLCRSVWWANLVLGTLIATCGNSGAQRPGVAMAIGTGAALLSMGRLGLDEQDGTAFRPVAFRTTLTLGMIMAVADAQALTLFGAVEVGDGHLGNGGLLLGSAAVLAVAVAGLYRLRVWGLLLAALGSAAVATLAATRAYDLGGPLPLALEATSAVQIALVVPIFVAIARRRAPSLSSPSRLAALVPAVTVIAMMGISAYALLVVGRPLVSRF